MITTVYTQNSIYQVDQDAGRARRVQGLNDPTSHWVRFADHDGWAPFVEVRWWNGVLLFVWTVEDDPEQGELIRSSHTSRVLAMDGPPIRGGLR